MNPFIWVRDQIQNRVEMFGDQMIAFGIFGVINYPLYYGVWEFLSLQSYESLVLRVTATLLCFFLILKKYWPKSLKPWLATYWYLTLLFCLPFFFTFMLLKNQFSNVWLMSTMLVMVWLMLLVDWVSFIILLTMGIGLAVIAFEVTTPAQTVFQKTDYLGLASQYFGALVVVLIFARNKEQAHRIQLKTVKAMSASIAHELRTPLRAISCSLHAIQVNPEAQKEVIRCAEEETKAAFNIIDMLLTKSSLGDAQTAKTECSVREIIEAALARYPFKPGEREKVQVDMQKDFSFKANQLLLIHVLFNLLKNALYHIRPKKEAQIFISTQIKRGKGVLAFKDTGVGISEKIRPNIFDQFFSETQHGTGIGLYFTKQVIESFQGKITCQSEEDQYTQFLIQFPILKNNKRNAS